MSIGSADWHDILPVLHETYRIWNAGLSRSDYQRHLARQMAHPWARRHLRFVVRKVDGVAVASCKLYDIDVISRGRNYRVLGIGAVYTMERFRGKGYAADLIEQVTTSAEEDGYDGILLFSEIGTDYYAQFGFEEFGAAEFCIYINDPQPRDAGENTRFPAPSDVDWMCTHYMRWLRSQPFGVARTDSYLDYKLRKETFLQHHSQLSWPAQELIVAYADRNGKNVSSSQHDLSKFIAGYMLIEQGGATVRILEVIGTEAARAQLWTEVLARSVHVGAQRIRGWESALRDFTPGLLINNVLPEELQKDTFSSLQFSERDWGIPMFLALNADVESWFSDFPCPLLELDHF